MCVYLIGQSKQCNGIKKHTKKHQPLKRQGIKTSGFKKSSNIKTQKTLILDDVFCLLAS